MAGISELCVGKILTVYHRGIEKNFYMMVLKLILKGISKVYDRLIVTSLMRSLEKFWKACNKM